MSSNLLRYFQQWKPLKIILFIVHLEIYWMKFDRVKDSTAVFAFYLRQDPFLLASSRNDDNRRKEKKYKITVLNYPILLVQPTITSCYLFMSSAPLLILFNTLSGFLYSSGKKFLDIHYFIFYSFTITIYNWCLCYFVKWWEQKGMEGFSWKDHCYYVDQSDMKIVP